MSKKVFLIFFIALMAMVGVFAADKSTATTNNSKKDASLSSPDPWLVIDGDPRIIPNNYDIGKSYLDNSGTQISGVTEIASVFLIPTVYEIDGWVRTIPTVQTNMKMNVWVADKTGKRSQIADSVFTVEGTFKKDGIEYLKVRPANLPSNFDVAGIYLDVVFTSSSELFPEVKKSLLFPITNPKPRQPLLPPVAENSAKQSSSSSGVGGLH